MNREESGTPPEQLLRVQRMAAILAATVSGNESALSALRGGETPYPFLPPTSASQQSIQALPKTTVTQSDVIKDCAICLEMMGVGAEIKSMPCHHGFHTVCIETWLMRRDTCPVCRYKMGALQLEVLVDSEAAGDADDDSGDDGYEYDRVDYFD